MSFLAKYILHLSLFASSLVIADENKYITIRLVPGIDKTALEYIDQIVDPDERVEKIYESENVRQILEKVYGTCDQQLGSCDAYVDYVSQVFDVLKLSNRIDENGLAKEEISIPVRPKIKIARQISVKNNSKLYRIAEENYGRASDAFISTLENNIRRINPKFNKDKKIYPGDKIEVGYRTASVTFRIKNENNCEDVRKNIIKLANGFAIESVCHDQNIVRLPSLSGEMLEFQCPADQVADWPFNELQLELALIELDKGRNKCLRMTPENGTVAILDNGVEESEYNCSINSIPICPRLSFWNNSKPGNINGTNIGISFITREWPWLKAEEKNIENGEYYSHGTAVAALSSGGMLSGRLREKVRNRINLMIIKVAEGETSNPSFIDSGIEYVLRNSAAIANMSIESYSDITKKLDSNTNNSFVTEAPFLVVAAAGNGSGNVSGEINNIYPACKGGSKYPHIISVAALKPPNQYISENEISDKENALEPSPLATFSNYGNDEIDLAAPGVDVKAFKAEGGTSCFTGTSFSAPLVSFTAALLYTSGITEPSHLKARLLAGTDYSPSTSGLLFSRGTLNIEKTLRTVFLDGIEFVKKKDSPITYGQILNNYFLIKNKANKTDSIGLQNLFKMVFLETRDKDYTCPKNSKNCVRYGFLNSQGFKYNVSTITTKANTKECSEKKDVIEFKPEGSESVQCYPLSEIREITLSHFSKAKKERLKQCDIAE